VASTVAETSTMTMAAISMLFFTTSISPRK
jgi:hypothetical protein